VAQDDYSVGPTEVSPFAVADMGLSPHEVAEMRQAYTWAMDSVYSALRRRGLFAWQMLWNGDSGTFSSDGLREVALTGPSPLVTRPRCAAQLRGYCNASGHARLHAVAMVYAFTDGSKAPHVTQDLASFLLIRGPYAWLGTGWNGCDATYVRPAMLDTLVVGVPLGNCSETAPGSGVFVREYSRSSVRMDCTTWTGTFTPK
jgi:hypothetical protein